jgi:hypothetical protein
MNDDQQELPGHRDIRRMSHEDLDELNRQIAIYKAQRDGQTVDGAWSVNADLQKLLKSGVLAEIPDLEKLLKPPKPEQLDLWGGAV